MITPDSVFNESISAKNLHIVELKSVDAGEESL